jgi:Holliday junction DNA helicase RuvB
VRRLAMDSVIQSTMKECAPTRRDPVFENAMRPKALAEFVGQEEVKARLEVVMGAAMQRKEPVGHLLFSGPPGLGKTTLAHILARTMGGNLVVTSGPVLEKAADLAGVLTNLQAGDVLFIDEIHRLSRQVEEYLYSAMEDFALDVMLDSGPSARSVRVQLNRFTLVGATTRSGLLTEALRSRFGLTCRLEYYEAEPLAEIVARSAGLLEMTMERDAARELARRARGTPRVANQLVRWVRDYVQMYGQGRVDAACVSKALGLLAIDGEGLDALDTKLLTVLIDQYGGGPVGLGTLAVAVGEEKSTVEEVCEPYLIMQGFLKRTPRGREVTERAYQHLGRRCTK